MITQLFFFFSFYLILHSIAIRESPLMIYWLTSYSTDDLLKLFNSKKFFMKNRFSQMKQVKDIDLDRIVCYFVQDRKLIHTMTFNYVQIENVNPFSIKILNCSINRHYILVSFNVQEQKKTIENNLCHQIEKPSLFYCNITNEFNKNEIFFFDNQCYISNENNCIKDLAKYTLWNQQKDVIKYLEDHFHEMNKSCHFQNATFTQRLTQDISITGTRY